MDKYVHFLSFEDEVDLIVSFALGPHAQNSLTLMRSPQIEGFLHEEDRGVTVSGSTKNDQRQLLKAISWGPESVEIRSTTRNYSLNIQAVDLEEIIEAKRVLRKMNFDNKFEMKDFNL